MPKNEMKTKLGEIEPGTENFGGGFNKKSGTRKADFKTAPSRNSDWQGISKAPNVED